MTAPSTASAGSADLYPVPTGSDGLRSIFPTDLSRYIGLDQCRRYLRLHLHRNALGTRFMDEADVRAQSIRPLLTRSGQRFEAEVVAAVAERHPLHHFAPDGHHEHSTTDNDEVVAAARDLAPGSVLVLAQPRLEAVVGDWRIRGDADLVRLERDPAGSLHLLVADIKSSASAKVDHRLQVAFYQELLAALFAQAALPIAAIGTAILYRPSSEPTGRETTADLERQQTERAAAIDHFGVPNAFLELVADQNAYRRAVRELVTDDHSLAHRLIAQPFTEIPYHLSYKCDGCLYNEFCMKWSAERDDLSLLPHLDEREKNALLRAGVTNVEQVADLKHPAVDQRTGKEDPLHLVTPPRQQPTVAMLAASPPVGPRLDELVHRARAYRKFKGQPLDVPPFIPSKGYGSLPYSSPDQNPNLVRVFVDAQHDNLQDRVYLLGALVVANADGRPDPSRRRAVVHLAAGPPTDAAVERRLFQTWIDETIRAIVELAAPDAEGERRAPIHLIFYDRYEQRVLLDGLGRHASTILGATPLYDFVTQLAAFDSPVATFLDEEIKELKNFPMVCQSLQAVAAYRRFDWNQPHPFRDIFKERLFDFWGKLDAPPRPEDSPWFTNRARFGSQIPLEYAYAAWDDLPPPTGSEKDDTAPYRGATTDLLIAFQRRRLDAIEHLAADFSGNKDTTKTPFDLPALDRFEDRARSFADALHEFVTIERHVTLAAWKRARLAPPERRILAGETLIGRYLEADQAPGVAEAMRDNERRRRLRAEQEADFRLRSPDAKRMNLSKEQRLESEWKTSHKGLRVSLRLDLDGVDASLDQIAALSRFKPGDRVVIHPRWHHDTRLPPAEQVPLQPTAKQLLYAGRATFDGLRSDPPAGEQPTRGWLDLTLLGEGPSDKRGFAFHANFAPLQPDALYTIDPDPNDPSGMTQATVTAGLREGSPNSLLDRLTGSTQPAAWPPIAAAAQARFLTGLDLLRDSGALHGFEPGKRAFIGEHGGTRTLLVQGPPGTGKSYTTAFALLARLQGALAADLDYRVALSCKTHAAVDVLVENLVAARRQLQRLIATSPAVAPWFDAALFATPIFRLRPRTEPPEGVIPLYDADARAKDDPSMPQRLLAERRAIVAGTPGAIYKLVKEHGGKEIFGHALIDTLVLDEASQMNLAEAAMAALPLKPDGRLVVVGDHRQMPPIIKHDWENEARRSFAAYRTYDSLFATFLPLEPPTIRFAESFRLHAEMAEFLRREVYAQDGIDFHSRRTDLLDPRPRADPFVAAALAPAHPLVVIVHTEAASQSRNPFEQELIAPILRALSDDGLDPATGLGVVVPHRAQRAALQETVPALTLRDPETGAITLSAIDTVERFQGGERIAILVSATESDPAYLLQSAGFLLDPRRLTVALSRAKRKMILVASRSVFELFSPDEDLFAYAQVWKNLLDQTCTVPLWTGERDGIPVQVWGNASTQAAPPAVH